jgi:hypothetical protein
MNDFVMSLAGRIPLVLAIFLFRSVPFVTYACLSSRVRPRAKILALVLFSSATWAVARLGQPVAEIIVRAPAALAYFAAGGVLVYELGHAFARRKIDRPALFALCALWFVLAPALLLPSPSMVATIIIGWEIMLSAYSYCIDSASLAARPRLADCLFFLLVNPVLVYAERGQAADVPYPRTRGCFRALFGIATMLCQDAVMLAAGTYPFLRPRGVDEVHDFASYAAFGVSHFIQGFGLYFAHSGLASVQIGLMLVAGHRVSERYRFPFLSTSPQDFWHRWNAWMGSWALRYVFHPAARLLRRKGFPSAFSATPILAGLSTFVAVGALHDFPAYCARLHVPSDRGPSLTCTLLFAFLGLVVVAFAWLNNAFTVMPRRSGARRFALGLAWLASSQFVVLVSWLAVPSLSGRRLPLLDFGVLAHLSEWF